MRTLNASLRIGEKIGIGFGFIGLLFLGVIWQYHTTLYRSLSDYQHLLGVFEAKKTQALEIETGILTSRILEKNFLIQREERFAQEAQLSLQRVFRAADNLAEIDPPTTRAAEQIAELARSYQQRFQSVVEAWKTKGLTHDLGLQGAFRDAVHELETIASHYKTGRLYLQLLQIRRGEKDLGLRREEKYATNVLGMVRVFKETVSHSELDAEVKARLLEEAEIYRETFENYARRALANENIQGGKGRFREAAHRIEDMLVAHYVPDLERNLLQLRRREKDYLLRHDKKYVDLAVQELGRIHTQIDVSQLSAAKKSQLRVLLDNYQRDFLALVEQNDLIVALTAEMRAAVTKISSLVKANVAGTDQDMQEMVARINTSSKESARLMLWIVAVTALLGILFALFLTRQISRPLRRMAGLLDQLAYEVPSERMPHIPEGRDEVNAMAGSLNTMADHKGRFIDWWKASMRESDACLELEQTLGEAAGKDASSSFIELRTELAQAREAKKALLSEHYDELNKISESIVEQTEKLLKEKPTGDRWLAINTIRHSAKSIQNFLELLHFNGVQTDAVKDE